MATGMVMVTVMGRSMKNKRREAWAGRETRTRQALQACSLNASVLAALALLGGVAQAQDVAQRTSTLEPRLASTITVTDNVQPASKVKDGALMVQLSPGLRFSSNTGRVRGFVDYSLNGLLYAKTSAEDRFQNALSATLMAEAISNWAYIDLRSSITQQAVSAFGVQGSDAFVNNANRGEVWNLTLSPYVRGIVAGALNYEARVNLSETNTRKSMVGDSSNKGAQLSLAGPSGTFLSWSLVASMQQADFKAGRQTEDSRVRGSLILSAVDDLDLSVNAGVESNNFISLGQEQHGTYGAGLKWTPTPRTKLSAQAERQFFGNSHGLSLEHRFARSIWRVSDSKGVSSNAAELSRATLRTNYELFYGLFASLEPDPIKREAFVNNYLQTNGIDPSAVGVAGFLSLAGSLFRRQKLS